MTNGFNPTTVYSALSTRLGWRMPTSTSFQFTGEGLGVDGDSGRYYDDFHPIVNIANILDIQQDETIGASDYGLYLESLNKSNIFSVLNAVFDKQYEVENGLLVDECDECSTTISSGTNFVGWKFEVADGYALKALSAILTFDSVATFNLYLYHSKTKAALKTKSVTTLANEQKVVDLTDWVMDAYSYKGGHFYIGYFQSDLGSAKAKDATEESEVYKTFDACTVSVAHSGAILDTTQQSYGGSNSYGLNLDVVSYRDYTKKIITAPHLFDNALGYNMAANIIENFIFTMRTNGTERKLNNDDLNRLYLSLNTADNSDVNPYVSGIKRNLQKAIKELKNAFFERGTNKVLTPC